MEKTDESKIHLEPIVKSPTRDARLRNGSGFSLNEIKASGMKVHTAKKLGITIDYNRRTSHDTNIEQLKKLKHTEKKAKKKPPFVHKEKKHRIRTEKVKKKIKPIKEAEGVSKAPTAKAKKIPKKKIKPKEKPIPEAKEEEITPTIEEILPIIEEPPKEVVETKQQIKSTEKKESKKKETKKKEEVKPEKKGTPLNLISGLGSATVKKFMEVGVSNIEELIEEKPEELTLLVSGVSEERIKKWIDEGKALLQK